MEKLNDFGQKLNNLRLWSNIFMENAAAYKKLKQLQQLKLLGKKNS